MTRLLTCGYETGDVAEQGVGATTANSTLSAVSSTPTPRAGSYCLKAASTGGTTTFALCSKAFTLPAAKTEVWVRFAFWAHMVTLATEVRIADLLDASGAVQGALTYTAADGLLRLQRGTTTLIATASAAFAQDSWHLIEWRMQMTSATVGTTEVWLDGTQVINFSGDNTNTATFNVQTLGLGQMASAGISGGIGAYLAFDDIAINDTAGSSNNGQPGDGRVLLISPSGAGSSTQLTRGGTDTGANWSQVSELPPSLTQYVASATIGLRDLYACTDIGVTVTSIKTVEAVLLAQNSDVGGGYVAATVKSGATTSEATPSALNTTANYVRSQWETDPNTGAAWTLSAINALEAGITIR